MNTLAEFDEEEDFLHPEQLTEVEQIELEATLPSAEGLSASEETIPTKEDMEEIEAMEHELVNA